MSIRLIIEDDDGCPVLELDEDGIEMLADGLRMLEDMEPGQEIHRPSLVSNDGHPVGTASFVLRRA